MRQTIKPQDLVISFKPYQYRQKYHLAVSALMFFRFDAPDQLLPGHIALPEANRRMPKGQPLDEGMPKKGAEVLVVGSAHTPAGRPLPTMQTRLKMGEVDKTLDVLGSRHWQQSLLPMVKIDEPKPFAQMPLTLANAWGGPSFAENPEGRGFAASRVSALRKDSSGTLPTVQYPGETLQPGRATHRPATFSSLPMGYPQRRKKLGTYGKKWLKHDFPGYADNLNWHFFNCAPEDQWLVAPFAGGDPFTLEGFHPDHSQQRGKTPRLKPRAFLGTQDEPFREVPLLADTLWLFPEIELGVLIHHGSLEIQDSDGLDAEAIMLAYERPGAPRSLGHYQEVLALRRDPETAAAHAFHEAQLKPVDPSPVDPVAAAAERAMAKEKQYDAFIEEFGLPKPEEKPDFTKPPAVPTPSHEDFAAGRADLTKTFEACDQLLKDAEKEGKEAEAKLKEVFGDALKEPLPPIDAKAALKKAKPADRQAAIMESGVFSKDDAVKLDAASQELWRLSKEAPEHPLSSDAKNALESLALEQVARRQSLRGYDLPGIHLSDVDLTGLDLAGVHLAGAHLTRCIFDNANLTKASFAAATLEDCRFTDACLHEAGFGRTTLTHCAFRGADLRESVWVEATADNSRFDSAVLTGAMMQDSRFTQTSFMLADISNSQWQATQLRDCDLSKSSSKRASFLGCDLTDVSLRDSTWQETTFLNTKAPNAEVSGAVWRKVLISGATETVDWTHSIWRDATLDECGLRGAQLAHADLSRARLIRCDLGTTQMAHSTARDTLFSGCLLMQTVLSDADLERADFQASLPRKADFRRSNLRDAQRWVADMRTCMLDDADLHGIWPEIRHDA